MNFSELVELRDGYAKEIITGNMPITVDGIRAAFQHADERFVEEYPTEWANWYSKMKEFPIKKTWVMRLFERFGRDVRPRAANIRNVLCVFYTQKETFGYSHLRDLYPAVADLLDRFTWEELMPHRQCYTIDAFGIDPNAWGLGH